MLGSILTTRLDLILEPWVSGGWDPDHQGGAGGGQREVPLHGEQLRGRGERGDRPHSHR
jgi:hypothetical protein